MRERLKVGDIIVISCVFLMAAVLFFIFPYLQKAENANTVTVSAEGKREVYSLSENTTFDIHSNGHTLTVSIEDQTVCVTASDCPDNTCVHSGKISDAGQVIACVPARVTLSISGEEGAYDFIAG